MGRFLRLTVRIIALPFVVLFTLFLSFMGLEVKDPAKRREEEREQRPEARMQVAGDQDDDDKLRRWHFDRKDGDAFEALVGATKHDDNVFEPRVDTQTWMVTRKFRQLGGQES